MDAVWARGGWGAVVAVLLWGFASCDDRGEETAPAVDAGPDAAIVEGCPLSAFAIFPVAPVPACTNCIRARCCAAVDACANDPDCTACIGGVAYCAQPATYAALRECVRGSCDAECYPLEEGYDREPVCADDGIGDLGDATSTCFELGVDGTCDPLVQSYTCNWQVGAACDLDRRLPMNGRAEGFTCVPSGRHHVCEPCGLVEGLCHFGLTCVNYQCMKMCCDDQVCAGEGTCDAEWMALRMGDGAPASLGVCVQKSDADAGR